ncbi:hypothetical protein P3T23_009558 [Paraburkholderia sp. GAS448]|uniref:hypothetical protein n=1 Tax=Paraburkholderia sp. GAS448 TaxID=3035136 RepID=UPI003D1F76B4
MVSRDVLRTERRETIRQLAFRLAASGDFADSQAIEQILCRLYGVIETRRLFVDLRIRAELDRRCILARQPPTGTAL